MKINAEHLPLQVSRVGDFIPVINRVVDRLNQKVGAVRRKVRQLGGCDHACNVVGCYPAPVDLNRVDRPVAFRGPARGADEGVVHPDVRFALCHRQNPHDRFVKITPIHDFTAPDSPGSDCRRTQNLEAGLQPGSVQQ